MAQSTSILGPKRRLFQWLVSLVILLLPFGSWQGRSLLRIDVDSHSMHLLGQVLRVEELYLFLFFTLALGLGFLLITLIFGRVWCGWACPHTTLTDLAEWLARRLGLKVQHNHLQGSAGRKLLAQIGFLLLALLVGANLVWYFIEPWRFFSDLLQGQLHPVAWLTMVIVALLVYLDLAFVRRLMCRDFCPYGRFQTALVDPATLVLNLPDSEAERCIRCGACVRSCPMEIDIREGYQIECINCGRCRDACAAVMARRQEPGLIRYDFGLDGAGWRGLLAPRTLLLAAGVVILGLLLGGALYNRPAASLKIALSHTASSRLTEQGRQVSFFSAWVSNRSTTRQSYRLRAYGSTSEEELELKGQTAAITLEPGRNRELRFALISRPVKTAHQVEFRLRQKDDRTVATAQATLSPLNEREKQ